ncbi:hypothetical protein CRYUN_Cryun25bG0088900 [Craigia yunnanensis]
MALVVQALGRGGSCRLDGGWVVFWRLCDVRIVEEGDRRGLVFWLGAGAYRRVSGLTSARLGLGSMQGQCPISCWIMLNMSEDFCKELVKMCNSKGMVFCQTASIRIRSVRPDRIDQALLDVFKESTSLKSPLQLLIIILPDQTGSYGKIKRICETELGIVSQCCQPKQAARFSNQYFENLALKINVKVGGRNTVLDDVIQRKIPRVSDYPTIIFGADVTHPQPEEYSCSSIAVVVASMDWPEVTKYRGIVSAQPPREEIIQDLYKTVQDPQKGVVHSGMIRELLVAFFNSTGQKPYRIIFYRDGVSEGQFSQVLFYEVDAIRKACASLQEGYMPRVTFIVVQKRHHTRLFPTDRNQTDRSGNIQAVPPAYYAHLAAFRARYYVEDETSDSGSTGGQKAKDRNFKVRPLPIIKDNVKEVMFYC